MGIDYIKCGDCLELMKEIPDGSIDLILCDLPYGKTRSSWDSVVPLEPLWEQYKRIVKPNGKIVLFSAQPFTSALVNSNLRWFRYELIWHKTAAKGFLNAKKMPLTAHENILVFYKNQGTYNPQKTTGHKRKIAKGGGYKYGGDGRSSYGHAYRSDYDSTERYPRSVITISNGSQTRKLHPTQKPIELLEYLIKTYTNHGAVVMDNCMGSGSTGVACIRTGRRFIGIEKDPNYFQIAEERLRKAVVV